MSFQRVCGWIAYPHGLPPMFLPLRIAEGRGRHIFHAGSLQKDSEAALWGDEHAQGSVIASDFYNASAFAVMKDQEIIDLASIELLPLLTPKFKNAKVVVMRCGLSRFCVSVLQAVSQKRPTLGKPSVENDCLCW